MLLDLLHAVRLVNLWYQINRQVGLDNLVPLSSHWGFLSKGPIPYERMLQLPRQLVEGPIIVFAKNMSFYCARMSFYSGHLCIQQVLANSH